MQFALLIYESQQAFLNRKSDEIEVYTGAWRTYYKALVDAGVFFPEMEIFTGTNHKALSII